MGNIARLLAVLSLLLVSVGCATSTTIITNPPGATVSRGGVELGQTPYVFTTDMNVMSSETLQVTAATGESQTVVLRRSEIDPIPFAVTLGTCFFCGWTGIGIAGGVAYFFAGWKLPESTVVTFGGRPAALRPRQPAVARRHVDDDAMVF